MRWLLSEGFPLECPVSILNSLLVYLLWVKYRLADYSDGTVFNLFMKTALMSGVACCAAELLDFDEYRVIVTVNMDFFNQLYVAGSFAFYP